MRNKTRFFDDIERRREQRNCSLKFREDIQVDVRVHYLLSGSLRVPMIDGTNELAITFWQTLGHGARRGARAYHLSQSHNFARLNNTFCLYLTIYLLFRDYELVSCILNDWLIDVTQ